MRFIPCLAVGLLAAGVTVQAATFAFNTDPFAGSDALTTPGSKLSAAKHFSNSIDPRTFSR